MKGTKADWRVVDSRAVLNASFRSLLHSYTISPLGTPAPPPLLTLLSSPRAKLIDLDYLDEETGRGILHEAVRRNEMPVVEGCVRAGVDVFGRDRRGRGVLDGKVGPGGEGVRGYLRQYANASGGATARVQSVVQGTGLRSAFGTSRMSVSHLGAGVSAYEEAPSMKGYLAKYTNVARGYNPRWFVLSNGVLSYYRTREEEGVASRGSLAMGGATVRFGGEGKSVSLTSSTLSTLSSSSSSMKRGTRFEIWGAGQKWYVKAAHPAESARWVEGLVKSVEWAKKREAGILVGPHSSVGVGVGEKAMFDDDYEGEDRDDEEEEYEDEEEEEEEDETTPPHSTYPLTINALKAQLDLVLPASLPILEDLVKMMEEREGWFRRKLRREQRKNRVWEESLRSVVEEGEGLERELRRGYLRKRRGMPSRWEKEEGEEGREEVEKEREVVKEEKETKGPPPPLVLSPESPKRPLVARQGEEEEEEEEDGDDEFFDAIESGNLPGLVVHESLKSPLVSPSLGGIPTPRGDSFMGRGDGQTPLQTPTGTITRMGGITPLEGGGGKEGPLEGGGGILVPREVYAPYEILRTRLPLEADDRPSTSLWSVLKGSIGKDLTRIRCVPLLERWRDTDDWIVSRCFSMSLLVCFRGWRRIWSLVDVVSSPLFKVNWRLMNAVDVACEEEDAHRRIAFVAAFAMSNYSSTIGRIAKPFNPLLVSLFAFLFIRNLIPL